MASLIGGPTPTPSEAAQLFGTNTCIFYAWYLRDIVHPDRKLRVVYGSLGIGKERPFFEYGGLEYRTVADFIRGSMVDRSTHTVIQWDMHAWAEDEQGLVYDMCVPYYHEVAEIRGRELDFSSEGSVVIQATPRAELMKKGLTHLPAPSETQGLLHAILERDLGRVYRDFFIKGEEGVYDEDL